MHILLVEDNDSLRTKVAELLSAYGFKVTCCADGAKGLEAALVDDFDLIILDILMPVMSGWDVLVGLRKQKETPVIMLTARDSVEEKIAAFDQGADDYMVKPFDGGELIARIKSITKRSNYRESEKLVIGNMEIDKTARSVKVDGEKVELSSTEFSMVEMFVSRQGEVVSRSYIYKLLFSDEDESASNILDVYIYKLRRKLGKEKIKTKRGYGYIFNVEH